MFLNLEKKYVNLPNGERYAYIEKGEGDKVVLLIHGNNASSIHYEPLYREFPEGYRVIAPDLRGFGDSSYNKPFDTIHEIADDVALFLKELGVTSAYVVGWSFGGCVSQSLAARYPALVEKLVLLSSGSVKGYPIFKKDSMGQSKVGEVYESKEELALDPITVVPLLDIERKNDTKMMGVIWNYTIYTSKSQKRPDEDASEVFLLESCKERCLVDADWALMRYNITDTTSFYAPGEDLAKDIKCPVLAVNGEDDIVVPEIMTSENRQAIPSLKQVYYADCGHSVMVDQPARFLQDLLEFIG